MFRTVLAVALGAGILFLIGSAVRAEEPIGEAASIQYPIPELGNCESKEACARYCDSAEHQYACLNFAARYGLMSQDEIEKARNIVGKTGPGGCTGAACKTYCDNIAHIDECVTFAEANNLMSPDELAEAKLVRAAIRDRGLTTPGACTSKKSCDAYCGDPAHMEECILFAKEAGFMKAEEQADAEKMLAAIKKGAKPLPCRGKDECDAFCGVEENFSQCIEFAEAAGFMSQEEAAMARKTGGKGPGGCRRDECKTYCENPTHEEECIRFAEENGLLPEEDRAHMQEGLQQFQKALNEAPPEVAECLQNAIGAETLEALRAGTKRPSRNLGDQMKACFEKIMGGEGARGPGRGMPPEVESCLRERGIEIDTNNLRDPAQENLMRECFEKFGPQGNREEVPKFMPGPQEFIGPGKCASPEECKEFCASNPEACPKMNEGPTPSSPQNIPIDPTFQPGNCGSPEECQKFFESQPHNGPFQEFQGQYQQKFEEGYQKNFEQYPPPGNYPNNQFGPPPQGFIPPEGSNGPPPAMDYPSGNQGLPPPDAGIPPPPPPQPSPETMRPLNPPTLLGFFAEIFLGILR